MLTFLLRLFAAIAEYYSRDQLIQAGENKEKLRVSEAEREAEKKVEKVIIDIDSLDDTQFAERVSKWRRDS